MLQREQQLPETKQVKPGSYPRPKICSCFQMRPFRLPHQQFTQQPSGAGTCPGFNLQLAWTANEIKPLSLRYLCCGLYVVLGSFHSRNLAFLQDEIRPGTGVIDVTDRLCRAPVIGSVSPSPTRSPSSLPSSSPSPSPGFGDLVTDFCAQSFLTSNTARQCCSTGAVICDDFYQVRFLLYISACH